MGPLYKIASTQFAAILVSARELSGNIKDLKGKQIEDSLYERLDDRKVCHDLA